MESHVQKIEAIGIDCKKENGLTGRRVREVMVMMGKSVFCAKDLRPLDRELHRRGNE